MAGPDRRPLSAVSHVQRALEQSEASVKALLGAISDPAMLLDREGTILMANKAFAEHVGMDSKGLAGQSSYSLLPPAVAHLLRGKLEEILRQGIPQVIEESQQDTTYVTTLDPVFDESGRISRVAVVYRDISSLRQTEAKLKDHEVLYRNIVESANDGIATIEETVITYVNPRLEEIGGYKAEELIGTSVTRFIHPDELPKVVARLRERKDNDNYRARYETILKDKNGRDVFVEVNSSALSIRPGKDVTLVIIRDVTDRRQSELALREAEDRYRRLVDHSLAGIYITKNHELTFCNQKFSEIFGYDRPEDMIGLPVNRLVTPDNWDLVDRQVKLRESGQVHHVHYEFQAVRRDNTVFDVEVFGSRFDDCGQPAILGMMLDVTERKTAARSLAESNTRLQALLQAMPDVVYFKDLEGRNLTVNRAFEAMVGLPPSNILGRKDSEIFPPELAEKCRTSDAEVIDKLKPIRLQETMTSPSGQEQFFETYKAPIFDDTGRPAGLVGVSRNITEQKHREKIQSSILSIAQAAISSESLETLFRSIHAIIAGLMPAKNFYIALYDESRGLVSFPYFVDEFDAAPGPKPMGKGLTEYVFRTGEPLLATPGVFDKLEREGEVESIGAPSIDWLGVPLQTYGRTFGVLVVQSYAEGVRYGEEERDILRFVSGQVAMAISRRRGAEEIQEREQFLSSVLDSIQDGISILGKDFSILRVNRAMEQWYAHVMPLVGKKCHQAYNLRDKPCAVCPTKQTLDSSQAAYEIVPRVGPGGATIGWQDLYSFPFIDQKTGEMKGVIEYVRDITQRKQAEDRLQSSLREKEVLLREIHHRVKNNLQVIQSLISLQARQLKDEQAQEMYRESQRRIRSMALIHERLYQSTDLSRIEFADYLRSLTVHLSHSMLSDTSHIALDLDLEPVQLNINTAIPCGLIVNELVSNALKHAFPGERAGTVKVSIHKAGDGEFLLGVKDDGVGLPPGFDLHKSETLGMQIVATLVSQLGGQVSVGRGRGADFQIQFREAADQVWVENHE